MLNLFILLLAICTCATTALSIQRVRAPARNGRATSQRAASMTATLAMEWQSSMAPPAPRPQKTIAKVKGRTASSKSSLQSRVLVPGKAHAKGANAKGSKGGVSVAKSGGAKGGKAKGSGKAKKPSVFEAKLAHGAQDYGDFEPIEGSDDPMEHFSSDGLRDEAPPHQLPAVLSEGKWPRKNGEVPQSLKLHCQRIDPEVIFSDADSSKVDALVVKDFRIFS